MNPKLAAALACILWGTTYVATTTLLPNNPLFLAAARSLGGGLPLLLFSPALPPRDWWGRLLLLGTLNGGLFFGLLFVAALRLPGGVAGTLQAFGPMITILLAWPLLGEVPTGGRLGSVLVGAGGVALLLLRGATAVDPIGAGAALGAALCIALGGILVSRWGRPASLIAFTAWQLVIGGVELALLAAAFGDVPSSVTMANLLGYAHMGLVVTALAFVLWFKAIEGAGPAATAPFLLLVPIVAFLLDAVIKGTVPTWAQAAGAALVVASLAYGQRRAFARPRPSTP